MSRPPMITKLKKRISKIPEINLVSLDIPMSNGIQSPKLADILEFDVDDCYYVRKDIVEKIMKESKFEERLVSLKTPYIRKETAIAVPDNQEPVISISKLEEEGGFDENRN